MDNASLAAALLSAIDSENDELCLESDAGETVIYRGPANEQATQLKFRVLSAASPRTYSEIVLAKRLLMSQPSAAVELLLEQARGHNVRLRGQAIW